MAIDNQTILKELTLGEMLDIIECLRKASVTTNQPDRRRRLESLAGKLESANSILTASVGSKE